MHILRLGQSSINIDHQKSLKVMQSLVHIRRSEVPAYLQDSELYLSLDDGDDNEIDVPSNCLKMDTRVNSLVDLDHLLSTVRFWIASPYLIDILNFIVNYPVPRVKEVVVNYKLAFPTLSNLVVDFCQPQTKLDCNLATKHGCVELLKYLSQQKMPITIATFKIAAKYGHVNCMSYCLDYITHTGRSVHIDLLDWSEVIKQGHVNCVQFLVAHGMPVRQKYYFKAVDYNRVACLRYLLRVHPHQTTELILAAVKKNRLNCLKCIMNQKGGCEVDVDIWKAAMKAPKVSTRPTNRDKTTAYQCFEYLLSTVELPENQLWLVQLALDYDNISALRLLHQRGFPVNSTTVVDAEHSSPECLQYLLQEFPPECLISTSLVQMRQHIRNIEETFDWKLQRLQEDIQAFAEKWGKNTSDRFSIQETTM